MAVFFPQQILIKFFPVKLYNDLGLDGGLGWQYLQHMEAYSKFYSAAMKAEMLSDKDKALLQEKARQDPSVVELILKEQQTLEPTFYSSLLASPSKSCPWLTNALYINMDGQAAGCAYMKDTTRDGFGEVLFHSQYIIPAYYYLE